MDQHISKTLTELSKVPVPLEFKRPKTGDEIFLQKAIQTPAIVNSSVEEIKQVLRLVMVKIGLRGHNFPNDEEKVVLIDHIVSNFGRHKVGEIKIAFEMCISGKLDLDPKDAKCYENFSCAYFSTVMNSYQRWVSEAIKHIDTAEPPEQKVFTDEEIEDSQREDAERQYQMFLNNYELKSVENNKDILEKDNLLNPSESVVDFFKRKREAGYHNIYVKTKRDRP